MKKVKTLRWLFDRVKRRIPAIVLMCVLQVGGALLGVAMALGTKEIIDAAVVGDAVAFGRACLLQGSVMIGLLLCQLFSRNFKEILLAELDRDWKRTLVHGLLHGEYADVKEYHSGELINRLNNDVRLVNEGMLNTLPNVLSMLARLAAVMVVLAAMDWRLTVLIVTLGSVVVAVMSLLRSRLKILHKRVSEQEGRVSAFLQETLENLLVVQAMDIAGEIERREETLLAHRYEVQRKRKNATLLANTGINVLSLGARFFALLWCAARLLNGRISFGSLTAVTQLVGQLQAPMVTLSGIIPQYIAMTASAERLMELEAVGGKPVPVREDIDRMYAQMETLGAEALTFSYGRDLILQQASFALPKGAFAVITGRSGIGKSTLLKLLLGVFRQQSGQLFVQSGSQRTALDRSTRGLFAYVPQGNLLFSGTLRENLTVTAPDASPEQIKQALYVSAMDEFLPQLPQGLDTQLGEGGAGLSEGQAQRLAIARAVLGGAPVLLLDECTSALDEQTEKKVLQRLRALPDHTCIAVTHRPAAVALCDWQLEVDDRTVSVRRNND